MYSLRVLRAEVDSSFEIDNIMSYDCNLVNNLKNASMSQKITRLCPH